MTRSTDGPRAVGKRSEWRDRCAQVLEPTKCRITYMVIPSVFLKSGTYVTCTVCMYMSTCVLTPTLVRPGSSGLRKLSESLFLHTRVYSPLFIRRYCPYASFNSCNKISSLAGPNGGRVLVVTEGQPKEIRFLQKGTRAWRSTAGVVSGLPRTGGS